MKKLFCLFLVLVLTLPLCACGGEAAATHSAADTPLQAGFGKVCITPRAPVALSSTDRDTYIGVYEDVYLTCIALRDAAGTTVLMITVDVSYTNASNQTSILREVSKETGVPESNISYSCTHNHSGLDPSGTVITLLKNAAKEAAATAIADLSPASLEVGTAYPEGFNFVRHYQTDDGDWVGDNYYAASGKKAATAERKADNAMQLMHFVREGKQNILLVNWQAHAVYTYKMEYLCTDFIGSLRDEVSAKTGALVAYFQGAAGNLNPWSNLGDNLWERSLEGLLNYGKALAQYPIEAMASLTPVDGAGISITEKTYTAQVRRDSNDIVLAAASYRQVRENGGSHAEAVQAAGGLIHGDQGAEYVSHRSRKAGTNDIIQRVVRLGNVAFVIAPYEMFDDTGMYIKENSPYEMTFILGYTNGREGYMPSQTCIDHGCYEYEGSVFEAGTAEALAEQYLSMLNELK